MIDLRSAPALLLLFAGVIVARPASSAPERPNVLFIAVDDLNHWVGYCGRNPQAQTPNIDRLSASGVSFTNAHCVVPACGPSRAALLSGMRPSTTGCYHNRHKWREHIPEGVSLPATFKRAGYDVRGCGKTFHGVGPKSVRLSEWDEYHPSPRPVHPGARAEGLHQPLTIDLSDEEMPDWKTVDYCIEQLRRDHDRPFFLSCGLLKPHLPWAVPRKYFEKFPVDEIELPPYLAGDRDDLPPLAPELEIGRPTIHPRIVAAGRWRAAIRAYLATITFADACVGRLLDALDASPHRDNTIVVLWGDHGWSLGEKDEWSKFTLWEESTRAPLIWRVPGATEPGALCHRAVDFTCLYPTLCELAGVQTPGHVEGVSIVPLLHDPAAAWDGVAMTTQGYRNHSVRTERWRYIRYADGGEELYDHGRDEYEWTNLAGDQAYASQIERLREYLPENDAPME